MLAAPSAATNGQRDNMGGLESAAGAVAALVVAIADRGLEKKAI